MKRSFKCFLSVILSFIIVCGTLSLGVSAYSGTDNVDAAYPANTVIQGVAGSYNVIYKVNGRTIANFANVEQGGSVPTIEDPTLQGYTFNGWYPEIPPEMPDYNLELNAVFSPIRYTVNLYDDTTLLRSITVAYNERESLVCSNLPQKTGQTISGWSSTNGGNKEFEYGARFIKLTDVDGQQINYYAVWRLNSYYLNLYDGIKLIESFVLEYGEKEILHSDKLTPREGYTFMGWTKSGDTTVFPDNTEYSVKSDNDGAVFDFYAYWQKNPSVTQGDVSVEFSPKVLNSNIKLNVENPTSGSAVNIINGFYYVKTNKKIYKIEALLNNASIQPKGDVTFKIKLPESYNKEACKLFFVDEDGKVLTEVPCELKDGCFVFDSNRFGTYTIIDMKSDPKLEIVGYKSSIKVDFKTTVTFSYVSERLPKDTEVHWFINGKDMGTGESYTVKKAKNSYTVQLKALNKDGESVVDSETETVSVRRGFFDRILAFFRSIFGLLPKIVQK